MAHYSDSSDWEDFEEALKHAVLEEDIIGASWSAKGSPEDEDSHDEGPGDAAKITARAYQLEMLEASLKKNVIVAMDTGSGKTQVAVLRIKAEIERKASNQVIWFLATTNPLCFQQFGVIKSQIPSAKTKMIVGANNVDSWSKSTWDGALTNVDIVVSTHQVLLDALLHAFIDISYRKSRSPATISPADAILAHNCVKNHAGSRIMKECYWKAKAQNHPVPHVMGLTASPVIGSDISTLKELEVTLDACCQSPTRHRDELLAHTQRPSMFNVSYKGKEQVTVNEYTDSMLKIHEARAGLKLMDDPCVLSLRAENTDRSRRKLNRAIMKQDTYIQRSMKAFCRRNAEIYGDLGSWAADWYIYETIQRFMAGVKRPGAITENLKDAELTHLARVFQNANIPRPPGLDESSGLSDKVRQLINVLSKYKGDARGIVFVKERATTVVLGHILATHPEISKRYRTGTMVGTSFVPVIKQHFLDLAERDYSLSLEGFREGRLNLLVATSVLEEGIDVPACNLVICMDKPASLKSFIQRRGRARMRESHLYLFEEETDEAARKEWGDLEAEMKRHYESERREHEKFKDFDESTIVDYPELRVESTGARLTIHDAKSHLQHFCATLSSSKYVDFRPDYIIERLVSEATQPDAPIPFKATVLLPVSLPQNVRQATSIRAWLSEKDACKDAAFQAYKGLYEEGLLNDNLLPFKNRDMGIEIHGRPGMMEANSQYNPWDNVARAWNRDGVEFHQRSLKLLDRSGSTRCEFDLVLPVPIPEMPAMVVYLDHNTHFTLNIGKDVIMTDTDDATDYSLTLLSLGYAHRHLDIKEEDSAMRLIHRSGPLTIEKSGTVPFDPNMVADGRYGYLVRDGFNSPYYYESLLPMKPAIECIQKVYRGFADDPEDEPYLVVKKCPRGPGSFQRPPPPPQSPSTKPYSRILPASGTTVDTIPLEYAEFGFLMPSLIHYIGLYLTAAELSNDLLASLRFSDISMIVDAICATGARGPTNYERIEFLGDSILKLCTTVNVAATKLRWPEGLLSRLKDSIISNARLCSAAHQSGLDQFVITEHLRFRGHDGQRWRPPYISDLMEESTQTKPKREMSTKTLADVVESIIGVSYIDGGLPKALDCLRFFLKEFQFQDLNIARDTLFGAAEPKNMALPQVFQPLEELLDYEFREKSLLVEAMTHASFNVPGTTACLDRLEFIGDSILDHLIVQELYAMNEPAPLENWEMHLLRTAAVNGDILGFLVMEWSHRSLGFDVVAEDGSDDDDKEDRTRSRSPELRPTEIVKPLWSFMRYSSNLLTLEREVTCRRHEELRGAILEAMRQGTHYPWALLARLHAQKFLSDLFEALVGAIWVDSGSFDECGAFLERSGVLPYLRRLRRDGVHVLHPKEELGRLANSEEVEYEVREVERGDGRGVEYACRILMGEKELVEVGGARFREEAKVKAATEAVRKLSGRGP
ncbi:hypothetical protein VMCG_04359 [Cytospora schulzeri]|uniref:Dicer-like protein 2 n=1 Tax=Cytospora schulzeri TaxID=448051 RepID=A0A423WT75_9PEZI|nr:hypothetical protein VMCG_04359 [Valsa malicola]